MRELQYQLISFDLDGTLVDTAAEIAEAANRALEDHGIARRPLEEIALLIGAGTHELMRRLLAQVMREDTGVGSIVGIDAILLTLDRHYAATAGQSAKPYPTCIDALDALRSAGIRMVCVTNKELRHARRVLESTGLADYFELVIGGDSLPVKKPDAGVLRHVAQVTGCALERIGHVGDSYLDVESARNAGVAAWAVPYGYNAGKPISDANPQQLFDTLGAVAGHVLATRFVESAAPQPTPHSLPS